MRLHCAIRFLLGIAASVGAIPSAVASPSFPGVVKQTLRLPTSPDCSLCHGLGQTGYRTVTTTFGATMLDYGARAGDNASIQAALLQLQFNQSPLIADLIAGRDPNRQGSDPRYGCGSNAAPSGPSLALGLALAAVLRFRRSRRVGGRLNAPR
jgi:hypothetical protein